MKHLTHRSRARSSRSSLLASTALAITALVSPAAAQAGVTLELLPPGGSLARWPDSFERMQQLLASIGAGGELRIALPFAIGGGFEGLSVRNAQVVLDEEQQSVCIAGRVAGKSLVADLALAVSWSEVGKPARTVLGVRPDELALSGRIPALKGTPLDGFDLGGQTFIWAQGAWSSLGDLGRASEWFAAGSGALDPGWGLRGSVQTGSLPAPMRARLGLPDSGVLELSGTFRGDLGLLSGRAEVSAFDLRATLPPGSAAHRLPAWLTPLGKGERRLRVAFQAPSTVTLEATQELEADLGGSRRRFRLAAGGGTNSDATFV